MKGSFIGGSTVARVWQYNIIIAFLTPQHKHVTTHVIVFLFVLINAVDLVSGVHESRGSRLAPGPLLLSALRSVSRRKAVSSSGRNAVLSQLLRDSVLCSL